jgi:hypothetical protein
MKAPAGDPGDFCIALVAEATLFIPEIAKSTGTPERFQHVSPFAFFEVGIIVVKPICGHRGGNTVGVFSAYLWDVKRKIMM